MTIYFNTLKYHNNLQHPRAFLPLCFVGVGGRCCSDILFSGPRVRGPLGSFKLQLFHKQLLSVRSLSACWRMRHWVIVWNCGCCLNSILASKDRCSGWNAETIARVKTHLLLSVMFDFNDKLWKHYPRNACHIWYTIWYYLSFWDFCVDGVIFFYLRKKCDKLHDAILSNKFPK